MSRQTHAVVLLCAAVGAALAPSGARADVIQQTATLPPTTTNFTRDQVSPLSFQKFDPAKHSTAKENAVLDSVTLTFKAQVQNQFSMTFVNPATITESFKPADTGSPGPTITLFQPDGKTSLVTAQEPNNAPDLTRSVTFGGKAGATFPQTFSSTLAATSPYYIAPASTTALGMRTLSSAADLALFTKSANGPSTLSLPVSASAFATIKSSSGNGSGWVSTKGMASATVNYTWHLAAPAPQTGVSTPTPAPEPATVLLWGAGGLALLVARRHRRD